MTPDRDPAGPEGEPAPEGPGQTEPQAGPRTVLSGRGWLARGRELPIPPMPVLCPQPPLRRFTWGVRAVLVLAALFYSGLVIWNRATTDEPLSTLTAVLLVVAAGVAVVALLEAWRWAGRPRLSPSQLELITADLSPEQKQTVRRMARGRGPEVIELRPRAAAAAWAGQQNISLVPGFVALGNIGTLAQSSGRPVGLVLGTVVLLITCGGVIWALWFGHRARTLNDALHPDTSPPTVATS